MNLRLILPLHTFAHQRNDIAILTLHSRVTYSKDVSPICLPAEGLNEQFVSKDAAIIGWGTTKSGISWE